MPSKNNQGLICQLLINPPVSKKFLVEPEVIHSRVTSYGAVQEVGYVDYSGEPANIFGDFCILLRLNGTQGDWQGSQPS